MEGAGGRGEGENGGGEGRAPLPLHTSPTYTYTHEHTHTYRPTPPAPSDTPTYRADTHAWPPPHTDTCPLTQTHKGGLSVASAWRGSLAPTTPVAYELLTIPGNEPLAAEQAEREITPGHASSRGGLVQNPHLGAKPTSWCKTHVLVQNPRIGGRY